MTKTQLIKALKEDAVKNYKRPTIYMNTKDFVMSDIKTPFFYNGKQIKIIHQTVYPEGKFYIADLITNQNL